MNPRNPRGQFSDPVLPTEAAIQPPAAISADLGKNILETENRTDKEMGDVVGEMVEEMLGDMAMEEDGSGMFG